MLLVLLVLLCICSTTTLSFGAIAVIGCAVGLFVSGGDFADKWSLSYLSLLRCAIGCGYDCGRSRSCVGGDGGRDR